MIMKLNVFLISLHKRDLYNPKWTVAINFTKSATLVICWSNSQCYNVPMSLNIHRFWIPIALAQTLLHLPNVFSWSDTLLLSITMLLGEIYLFFNQCFFCLISITVSCFIGNRNRNDQDWSCFCRTSLFRQLCTLNWLLEAMNVEAPMAMCSITTCWSLR